MEEVGGDREELTMTADEINRFKEAFRDEKFREMLRDYAQEISDPENRRRYEEEIKLLEQERGNSVQFIHPEPFRAIKTSVAGKQKCFINICANDKVGKPECERAVSEEGHRGQRWSLPHSLHPGRQDRDPKGNTVMIYDVIFHPDTLHIASRNRRFMDLVDSTAIQGIQDAFKVTLDKSNVQEMKTKYKGTPQPCVIRKPIPGYEKPSEQHLAFLYPDEKRPKPTEPTRGSAESQKEPTKPNYTIKYRSFIDLQDFRCSRDSAQSPRPKEIVVTIDVPLLKSVTDTSLEVREKSLLLESEKPAYRLELPLAYSVDEDKGEAKFNKQRGQLTVTLPVLPPPDSAFDCYAGTAISDLQNVSDGGEKSGVEEEDELRAREQQTGTEEKKEDRQTEEQGTRGENGGEDDGRRQEEEEDGWNQVGDECHENVAEKIEVEVPKSGEHEEEEKLKEQNLVNKMEMKDKENEEKLGEDGCDRAAERNDSGVTAFQFDTSVQEREENSVAEKQHILTFTQQSCSRNEDEVSVTSSWESTPEMSPESVQGIVENPTSSEDSQAAAFTRSSEAPATDESSGGDVDDLATDQIFPTSERGDNHPPVLLREINEDGSETITSDHSTSAGFIFRNTWMFELD